VETVDLIEIFNFLYGLHVERRQIAEFCHRWKITEFALFGSVLREAFRPDSDTDVLVTFALDGRWKLDDLLAMRQELEGTFGHCVDLVDPSSGRAAFIRTPFFDN